MLFNTDTKSSWIQLRVTDLEKSELKKIAKNEGLTLTKFISKCISFYLENKDK